MDPSEIRGSKEEYSSSVSGWTMYIGSPVHETDCDEGDEHDQTSYYQGNNFNKDNLGCKYDDANDNSDDSMASDASSGPSRQELSWESERSPFDKHAPGKLSAKEKLRHKEKTKKDERRSKVERDELVLKAKAASTQARSEGKVRKTN
ncbi:protein SOB FIVE-LIKE 1-like isoform X2 [Mangifera indica]|nr:protein SOB FIVE-LIKE 1-like isoform X2 [Mangifera indica]